MLLQGVTERTGIDMPAIEAELRAAAIGVHQQQTPVRRGRFAARIADDQRVVATGQASALHHQQIIMLTGDIGVHQNAAAAGQGVDREGLETAISARHKGQATAVEGQRVHGFHAVFHDIDRPPGLCNHAVGLRAAVQIDLAAVTHRAAVGRAGVVDTLGAALNLSVIGHRPTQQTLAQRLFAAGLDHAAVGDGQVDQVLHAVIADLRVIGNGHDIQGLHTTGVDHGAIGRRAGDRLLTGVEYGVIGNAIGTDQLRTTVVDHGAMADAAGDILRRTLDQGVVAHAI